MPNSRGIEGPVRSMSRTPTECPARESERASWVVTEDLPTPPLPERTCRLLVMLYEAGIEDKYQHNVFYLVQRHICRVAIVKEGAECLRLMREVSLLSSLFLIGLSIHLR